jgi:hypothetical protein
VRRDIGVIAMKTSADGALLREHVCSIAECQRYAWSLPISLAVVGQTTPAGSWAHVSAGRRTRPWRAVTRGAILGRRQLNSPLRVLLDE